jgi:hypothetical protein
VFLRWLADQYGVSEADASIRYAAVRLRWAETRQPRAGEQVVKSDEDGIARA